jgi:hypothetical protein
MNIYAVQFVEWLESKDGFETLESMTLEQLYKWSQSVAGSEEYPWGPFSEEEFVTAYALSDKSPLNRRGYYSESPTG